MAQSTNETRTLGWYAVRRVHFIEWLSKQKKNGTADELPKLMRQQVGSSDTTQSEDKQPPLEAEYPTSAAELAKQEGESKSKKDERKRGTDERKLRAVVNESHTILAKANAVFPFDLFPDTVSIDRHKLTHIHRVFFNIESTVSVPIENIKNIEADIGPFFGSLTITSDLFVNNTQRVHFLARKDAKKIQKLVQGAVVAQRENIDLNKIETEQLRKLLVDLGSGHSKSISV